MILIIDVNNTCFQMAYVAAGIFINKKKNNNNYSYTYVCMCVCITYNLCLYKHKPNLT